MSQKSTNKRAKILEEILVLKNKRRVDIIKIACAILLIIVVILGKPLLEQWGLLPQDNMIVTGAMYIIAILLAGFAGFASSDYAKSGRRIDELCTKNSISKDEIRTASRL